MNKVSILAVCVGVLGVGALLVLPPLRDPQAVSHKGSLLAGLGESSATTPRTAPGMDSVHARDFSAPDNSPQAGIATLPGGMNNTGSACDTQRSNGDVEGQTPATPASEACSHDAEFANQVPDFTAPVGDWSERVPLVERSVNGAEALALSEACEAEISLRNGMPASEVRARLAADPDLWLDRGGRMMNICAGLVARSSAGASPTSPSAIPNSTDAFKLHSLPGCGRVVYLDFTGHTTTGTPWNWYVTGGADIVSAPFDTDGVPSTFSAAELELIKRIWARVAEDFSPFAVDVTTEDPGTSALVRSSSTDSTYGVRVVVSPTSAWYPNAGGVAYLNSFGVSLDVPAFVFSNKLGPNNEKYVAEAISHEAGHTFNLAHKGVTGGSSYYMGHGNWAPIMGVGYYRSVVQWSRGEYVSANSTQDELASIAAHGTPLVTDDYGATAATAAQLPGPSVFAIGLMERPGDIDLFRLDVASGNIVLAVSGTSNQPNADIRVELLDANLTVLQSSNPDGLSANIAYTASAGTFYLRLTSVGFADPGSSGYSTYGSIGEYKISGTIPAAPQQALSVVLNAPVVRAEAPASLAFNSTGTTDPLGGTLSYKWTLGNGATSTAASCTTTYKSPGTYVVTLTVKSTSGQTATKSTTLTILPSSVFDISALSLSGKKPSVGTACAVATYTVRDATGAVRPGVTLTVLWSNGMVKQTGVTNALGQVVFTSPFVTKRTYITASLNEVLPPAGFSYKSTLFTAATSRSIYLVP